MEVCVPEVCLFAFLGVGHKMCSLRWSRLGKQRKTRALKARESETSQHRVEVMAAIIKRCLQGPAGVMRNLHIKQSKAPVCQNSPHLEEAACCVSAWVAALAWSPSGQPLLGVIESFHHLPNLVQGTLLSCPNL